MDKLTQPTKGKKLKISHFPTLYQALIFRLWEMVPASKIAEVIKTTTENVINSANVMGLAPQKNLEQWHDRGYISIIKAVWNLLPYEQIFTLLDWDEERLAYCLKEDDFLSIKLGEKCDCPFVLYTPLTKDEEIRTSEIKRSMLDEIRVFDKEETALPFDFFSKKYPDITTKETKYVVVDSSWCIECSCKEAFDFIEDFKKFAFGYGVTFSENTEKKIVINTNLQNDDEEYHEIEITSGRININAATSLGVLRALYFLEDLAESTQTFSFDKKIYKRKTKIKTRFIYSFCGLYGDVLDKDTSISFPDELLSSYGRKGINGVWIQGVLYKLAPYPFIPEYSTGWEKRLENLDALTKRAARFGIKIYMYINEPRNLPLSFFESNPQLKGAQLMPGFACLCTSHPDTHKYLKEAIQTVCRKVSLIGGFFNITQTENTVLCHSNGNSTPQEAKCPVCSKKEPSEVIAKALTTMAEAVYEVNPNIKFFYYAWALAQTTSEEQEEKVFERLPKNVIILQVSETGIPFEIGGCKDEIVDYSLSIVGPGELAKRTWKRAEKYGLETAAKVQINNSWECSSAPFLPVYENVSEHIKKLSDEGVMHIMLSWTLGGYVSDNLKIVSSYFIEDENAGADVYTDVLCRTYGSYADIVKEAVHHFCEGFKNYPFNWCHIYKGPSNGGVSNLLYPEPSGMKATMTGFTYDDLNDMWIGKPVRAKSKEEHLYTPEILEQQYRLICKEWEKGLEIIKDMPLCEFKDMAIYGYTLFKSSHNQIMYYMERDSEADNDVMADIIKSEKQLAILAYKIMLKNASVGFEAANHYYVTKTNLAEKIVQCDYLLKNNKKRKEGIA